LRKSPSKSTHSSNSSKNQGFRIGLNLITLGILREPVNSGDSDFHGDTKVCLVPWYYKTLVLVFLFHWSWIAKFSNAWSCQFSGNSSGDWAEEFMGISGKSCSHGFLLKLHDNLNLWWDHIKTICLDIFVGWWQVFGATRKEDTIFLNFYRKYFSLLITNTIVFISHCYVCIEIKKDWRN
jgi:hypothetical protein